MTRKTIQSFCTSQQNRGRCVCTHLPPKFLHETVYLLFPVSATPANGTYKLQYMIHPNIKCNLLISNQTTYGTYHLQQQTSYQISNSISRKTHIKNVPDPPTPSSPRQTRPPQANHHTHAPVHDDHWKYHTISICSWQPCHDRRVNPNWIGR